MDFSYINKSIMEIVEEGEYNGRKYAILDRGHYPTAYVAETKVFYDSMYDDRLLEIEVHGGFTFLDFPYWKKDQRIYLGWDYGHVYDYKNFGERGEEALNIESFYTKYTVEDVREEVFSVIDQLNKLEKGE